MRKQERALWSVLAVMSGFFIMGFVDVAGIAANYVKRDFGLNDALSNLIPMLAFLWFIILSIPTGILMGRIGRKNTALLSLTLTLIATLLPLISYSFVMILLAFAVMGIGNTMMQVSFNPLLTNVVAQGKLTSYLTLGQFTRSIASFLGPVIAGAVASWFGDWKFIFAVYALTTFLSMAWLFFTVVPREQNGKGTLTYKMTLQLFKDGKILFFFLGILFFIGIDVGLNTSIPRFLMARTHMQLEYAGLGTSLYFAARVIGSLVGAFVLFKYAAVKYLRLSMWGVLAAFIVLLWTRDIWMMLGMIALIGLACANIFSIILSLAIQHRPDRANEVTAIVLMGVAGGALTTPLMGIIADHAGQVAAMAVLLPCMLYILWLSYHLKSDI